jgi:hypothetical protein
MQINLIFILDNEVGILGINFPYGSVSFRFLSGIILLFQLYSP